MNRKRGFTLIELLVVIAIIALLIGLLLPALAKAQKNAKSARDLAQTKQIHQGMLVFAESHKGWLPVPGKVNRALDPHTGLQLPGRGPEDKVHNWSAPMYSLLIAQDFFGPDLCIGTTEVADYVVERDEFDYAAYRPDQDQYWDPGFQSNLDGGISNTSYAHLSICGKRKDTEYKNTNSTETAIISSRGTRDGAVSGGDYARSPTLALHGPDREWVGNICFNDNSAKVIDNFFPATINYEAQDGINPIEKDNIFAAEFTDFGVGEASGDCWMTISVGADDNGDEIDEVWDPDLF